MDDVKTNDKTLSNAIKAADPLAVSGVILGTTPQQANESSTPILLGDRFCNKDIDTNNIIKYNRDI